MKAIYFLFLCAFVQCKQPGGHRPEEELSSRLQGIWWDGESINATFKIEGDRIYWVEYMEEYPYELREDSIFFNLSGIDYAAQIVMDQADTMTWNTEYGAATYSRGFN